MNKDEYLPETGINATHSEGRESPWVVGGPGAVPSKGGNFFTLVTSSKFKVQTNPFSSGLSKFILPYGKFSSSFSGNWQKSLKDDLNLEPDFKFSLRI